MNPMKSQLNQRRRNQKRLKNNMNLPLEIWYIIFRFYLPDFEKYRLLFVCKKFNALIKSIESLPSKFKSKFRRKKYYLIVSNRTYFYGESSNFVLVKNTSVYKPVYHLRKNFDKNLQFMFTSTKKQEICQFFKTYCMPIHYVQLENTLSYPAEVGTILHDNFCFDNNRKIQWTHDNGSTMINVKNLNFEIKKLFYFNKEISPIEYLEHSRRMSKLPRLSVKSFANIYVLKCFSNMAIIDLILSHREKILPKIVHFV